MQGEGPSLGAERDSWGIRTSEVKPLIGHSASRIDKWRSRGPGCSCPEGSINQASIQGSLEKHHLGLALCRFGVAQVEISPALSQTPGLRAPAHQEDPRKTSEGVNHMEFSGGYGREPGGE